MDAKSQLRILLIGNGGREHALAWKLNQSPRVDAIYVVPGNGATAQDLKKVQNVHTVKADDFPGLVTFAKENGINFVVPGPEATLVAGIEGHFRKGMCEFIIVEEIFADRYIKLLSDALDRPKTLPAWKAQRSSPKILWLGGISQPQALEVSAFMTWRNRILIVLITILLSKQMGCMYILEALLAFLYKSLIHTSSLKSTYNNRPLNHLAIPWDVLGEVTLTPEFP